MWAARALWLMLAVSLGWLIYAFASEYGLCRAAGTGKIGCFFIALVISGSDALVFAVATIGKLLMVFLP
jgi:hypothetical protein